MKDNATPETVAQLTEGSLQDLVALSADITTRIIQAGGELTNDLEQAMKEVDLAVAHKIDGYAGLIERLEREADYWSEQAEIRAKVSKALLTAAQYRSDAIRGAMIAMGKDEVLGVDHRFKLQNASQQKLLLNESAIPESYKMQVTTWVVDKERLRADLKAGAQIEGARLEQGQYVRAYMNKGVKK